MRKKYRVINFVMCMSCFIIRCIAGLKEMYQSVVVQQFFNGISARELFQSKTYTSQVHQER